MPRPDVRLDDIGTEFRVQLRDQDGSVVDLTGSSSRKIYLTKPDGSVLEKVAILGSTEDPLLVGSDGWMHYISISGDIDQVGEWWFEGYVEFGTKRWTSETTNFSVSKPKWQV